MNRFDVNGVSMVLRLMVKTASPFKPKSYAQNETEHSHIVTMLSLVEKGAFASQRRLSDTRRARRVTKP
jgi:hypothetical protein